MFKQTFILKFIIRVLIINITGLFLLYDTLSFNQGLISFQSLIYSLNSTLLYIFIFTETAVAFLQYYGLDFEFINLVLLNLKNLDYNFVKLVVLDKSFYLIFLSINLILLINLEKILSLLIINKKLILVNKYRIILLVFFLFFIIIFLPFDANKKIRDKVVNFKKTISQYSLFRNDNWFIYLKSQIVYDKESKENLGSVINDFSSIINYNNYDNIFIIINESYPNFKNRFLKNRLHNLILGNQTDNITVKEYKKLWSKKYSTQGAELELFCGKNQNFLDFKKNSLGKFIKDNGCYFKDYKSVNKVFIHSHELNSFNRNRYDDFFENLIGFKQLKDFDLDLCEGSYISYCDHQILSYIRDYAEKEKNMIIFLTVNNHIPNKLISKVDTLKCKDHHPLNILDQMCNSYHNQAIFNIALSKFIHRLNKRELIIFFSDTPPLFPVRERIHFEDYINVYTFEKK